MSFSQFLEIRTAHEFWSKMRGIIRKLYFLWLIRVGSREGVVIKLIKPIYKIELFQKFPCSILTN